MIRKALIGLCALAVLLVPSVPAAAQTKGIGITPALEEVTLAEGQHEAVLEVSVVNGSDSDVSLRISTLDFGALDDSGGIAFLGRTGQEASAYGLSRWMKPDRDVLRLGAGQSDTIHVVITDADDLSPGGHYGAVVVSAVSDEQPSGDAVAVQPAASTLVLLKKTSGASYGMELSLSKTNKSLINLPKSSQLVFKNTGNIHVVPRGTVELRSPTGSVIKRGVINEQSSYVLPESSRKYDVELTGSSAWLPGRYQLVTEWRYDGQETFNQTVEYVWYIGKATIILIIGICSLIVLIMYIRYRRRPPTRY